jgi:hypothetical protein
MSYILKRIFEEKILIRKFLKGKLKRILKKKF